MKFHLHIKFRAFGITFGALDQTFDGASTLEKVIVAVLPILTQRIAAAAFLDPAQLAEMVHVAPHVIYDASGVLLEVVV